MLFRVIAFSVTQRWIFACLLGIGIWSGLGQLQKLAIDAVPDVTNNQVQVLVLSSSLSTEDMEKRITYPLEQACLNIPSRTEIRSFVRAGLSVITIVFEEHVDIYWARQQISERLQALELPPDATVQLAPIATGLGEIYQYFLKVSPEYEKVYSLAELRTLQDWVIRRQLLQTQGVADVASFGGHLKEYHILIHLEKMVHYGISFSQIIEQFQKNHQNIGGGYLQDEESVLYLRTEGQILTPQELLNLPIMQTLQGQVIRLSDIATLEEGHALRFGAMTFNGKSEVVGAVVMMLKGENSSQVIQNIKQTVQKLNKQLPQGIQIEPFLDRTKMVNMAIHTVQNNLTEGAIIVVVVLILFLGNLRAGLIVASVIPLAMLFAFTMMNLFGVSGNLMSLGALDFGLIVDGSVIIVEALLHHQNHPSKTPWEQHVSFTTRDMMKASFWGQLIILIVYLPIFFLNGIEGKMFVPMAQTVLFALMGAFLLSITYIPWVCSWALKSSHSPWKFSEKLIQKLEQAYRFVLERSFSFTLWLIGGLFALAALTIYLFLQLGGEFIPELPEGDFAIETRLLSGASLEKSIHTTLRAEKVLLQQFPNEIEKIVGKTGTSEIPTDPMPLEASDLMIILKPRSHWKVAHTYPELVDTFLNTLQNHLPGVYFSVQYPVAMRFNELIGGAKQQVVCKLFGEDIDTLQKYASLIRKKIETLQGATSIYEEQLAGMPQIILQMNREAMAYYGVSVESINQALLAAQVGIPIGNLYQGEKNFAIRLKYKQETHQALSLETVRNLPVPTLKGNFIPLHYVANPTIQFLTQQIQREDSKRRLILGFNVQGRDVESAVLELQSKLEKLHLPTGYHIHYGGSYENLQHAKEQLLYIVPVVLVAIFVLLFAAFQSMPTALVIFLCVPFSAIGGVWGLWIRDLPFSISAGVGFIALFGVAVLNGIVLVAELLKNPPQELHLWKEHLLNVCSQRLRPILMTASVAALGFLPMALSTGEGAEVQRPLATVVIAGLIISTFLIIIILPNIFFLLRKWIQKQNS